MLNNIKHYFSFKHPYYILGTFIKDYAPRHMSDKFWLKVTWFQMFGERLDLKNPKTFNEKLQWLKVYDHNPLYPKLVDKYEVKKYVARKIGAEHVIPTLAVYDSVDEIDIDKLPDQFVLKCTHDSGSVIICRDKSNFNLNEVKGRLRESLERNYYWNLREWPYMDVLPRIIVEPFIGENIQDYRVYCFNGQPKLVYSYFNKSEGSDCKPDTVSCNIFDINWKEQQFHQHSLPGGNQEKPVFFDDLISFSKILASGLKFARVDFLCNNNILLCGEITLFPGGGFSKFHPEEADLMLGKWLDLSASC